MDYRGTMNRTETTPPLQPQPGQLGYAMRLEVLAQDEQSVVIRIPVEGNTQPFGILHGGANGVLVEEAASRLAYMNCPEGRLPVGTELNVSQLLANTAGFATATASVIRVGSSSMTAHVEVVNDDAELTAVGRLTCVFVRR